MVRNKNSLGQPVDGDIHVMSLSDGDGDTVKFMGNARIREYIKEKYQDTWTVVMLIVSNQQMLSVYLVCKFIVTIV